MAPNPALANGDLPDTALHVLLALVQPRHGYVVMKYLEEISDGEITLGPASLYTTLKKLSATGLIKELEGEGTRRTYRITPAGREVLARNIERRRRLLALADRILEEA